MSFDDHDRCRRCGAPDDGHSRAECDLRNRLRQEQQAKADAARTPVLSDLAREAFEAYGASTGGMTWDGRPIPPFDEVRQRTPHVAAAWEAAVSAVLAKLGRSAPR